MSTPDLVISQKTISGFEFSLRPFQAVDLEVVMALEKSAHTHPWRRANFEDCIKGRQKCWLAETSRDLIALVVFTHGGGDAELLNLSVSPKYQRRGIGSTLVQFAKDSLQEYADMLFLEVRVSNIKAIELYAKEGFFEVGQRRNYYPTANGYEDALLMACQLK